MANLETAKEKIKEFGSKAKDKAMEVKNIVAEYVKNNSGMVMMVLPMIVPVAMTALGNATGQGKEYREHCLVEDNRTGEDLMTVHPLTNSEIMELGDRMQTFGQSKGEALRDMGLLKKERSRK